MKLTQTQRATTLAQFMAAAGTVYDRTAVECKNIALDMLRVYEAELASWPDDSPVYCGFKISQEEADKLRAAADKIKLPRNPENIDFAKYPIPAGYTLVNEEDAVAHGNNLVDATWMFFGVEYPKGWKACSGSMKLCDNWTYLRPLREGEVPSNLQ